MGASGALVVAVRHRLMSYSVMGDIPLRVNDHLTVNFFEHAPVLDIVIAEALQRLSSVHFHGFRRRVKEITFTFREVENRRLVRRVEKPITWRVGARSKNRVF